MFPNPDGNSRSPRSRLPRSSAGFIRRRQVSSTAGQQQRHRCDDLVRLHLETRHPVKFLVCLVDSDSRPALRNVELLTKAKSLGFSDRQIAHLTGTTEDAVLRLRRRVGEFLLSPPAT